MRIRGVRGLGPGPVFVYEWINSARRWPAYALRSSFVLGLLAALLVTGMSRETRVIVRGLREFNPPQAAGLQPQRLTRPQVKAPGMRRGFAESRLPVGRIAPKPVQVARRSG
jgi:hypothetical protein